MKPSIKISIPTPCHENWAAMTPTEKGRFCNSCQKQVVDFTRMGDAEIAGVLKSNTGLCARVLPSQTDRQLHLPHHRKRHAATIAAVAVLAASPAIASAQMPTPTEQQPVEHSDEMLGKVAIVPVKNAVQGMVVDENGQPLPGTVIYNRSKDISTSTDISGNFRIEAENGNLLQISDLGVSPLEIKIESKDFNQPLKINPRSSAVKSFFGRIFHRIGNLFR